LKVIRGVAGRVGRRKQLAIIVDGPNILRKELGLDLEEIRKISESMGRVRKAIVVLNRQAPEKLVEAVANAGFDVKISFGKPEVDFTIAAMEAAFTDKIQTLILATRSAAYLPIIHKIKEIGKEVVVIGAEPGFSVALKKAADLSLALGEGPTRTSNARNQGQNDSGKTKRHKNAEKES